MSKTANVSEVLKERGARYGVFAMHAAICQALKEIMWSQIGWARLQDDQKQALEVIQDKVARILNGDPDYPDNWVDIEGYARLVRVRLEAEAAQGAQSQVSTSELPAMLRIPEGSSKQSLEQSQ